MPDIIAFLIGFVAGTVTIVLGVDWHQEREHRRWLSLREQERRQGHVWRPCDPEIERRG